MGFTEGRNLAVETTLGARPLRPVADAGAELVGRPVAVIAATRSSAPGLAAKAATSTIPVVFQSGGDPVKDGLVASLNRRAAT